MPIIIIVHSPCIFGSNISGGVNIGIYVDRHIKTYWDKLRFIGLSNAEEDKFKDATCENSVRISKFLEGLNLDPIMAELNKHYSVSEGEEMYPRRAMFKTMVFRKIKKIRYYTRTENHLNNHAEESMEPSFNGKTFTYTPEQEINYLYRKYCVSSVSLSKWVTK